MANLPIEERLLHYFLAMGAQQVEPTSSAPAGLSLLLGGERVHVTVLKNDAFGQRSKIVDTILGLPSLRGSANQLYLAAPRLLAATIDAAVFRSYGIGLLLFDDRRIEEAVAPQSVQVPQQGPAAHSPDQTIMAELTTLKSMYLEMEKSVVRLRDDLRSLQETVRSPSNTAEQVRRSASVPTEAIFGNAVSQLPSFFTNNPWLDVLSKRGRAEGEPIAG